MLQHPKVGKVNFGDLRRLTPVSSSFGFDRGTPIDRYYINLFLKEYELDIRGKVLEIGDSRYTKEFGGDRVVSSEILSPSKTFYPATTIIGDLISGQGLPDEAFDCMVFTQTLQCFFDVRKVIANCKLLLRKEGILLATLPGISRIQPREWDVSEELWRFTFASAKILFEEAFGPENVIVKVYGNVLAAIAFLSGFCAEELSSDELDYVDPHYDVLIAVRAAKN